MAAEAEDRAQIVSICIRPERRWGTSAWCQQRSSNDRTPNGSIRPFADLPDRSRERAESAGKRS
jgi:hypothetical protein